MTKQFAVKTNNERLDKFLVKELDGVYTRGLIQKSIVAGLVKINERYNQNPAHLVHKGDNISFSPLSQKQKTCPINLPLSIIYQNDELLIIDKPAGLSVHPGAGHQTPSLSDALLFHFPQIAQVGETNRAGIVHRLDKDTSGCLLVALTPRMYAYLKQAFLDRTIKKEYVALTHGTIIQPHFKIDANIGRSPHDFRKKTTINPIEPKPCLTEVWTTNHYIKPVPSNQHPNTTNLTQTSKVDEFTLIKVKLHTGRTHQIRVHMASVGHPLCGDTLYGAKRQDTIFNRQFLHANRIEILLPDQTWIEAESPLPPDLNAVLKQLYDVNKTTNRI